MEYEVVYWENPGFGICVRRSKELLVIDDNPSPLRVGTVLREGGAIGVVIARRKTLEGVDIHGHSVAVEVLYSTLMEKFKMSKDLKYAVWSLSTAEVLKGEMATAARSEPKMFVTALLEAEAKAKAEADAEWRRTHPVPDPIEKKEETKPVGRTAVRRTPMVKPEPVPQTASTPRTPVPKTPVQRTPVKPVSAPAPVKPKVVDPIEAMRQKLSRI